MTFDFDESDLRVINDALVRLPYAQVVALIDKMNQRIVALQGAADDVWQPAVPPVTGPFAP
jgi:hypothetical protein